MPRYHIAHLNEQGQDMIIIPLESSFDHKTEADQGAILSDIQAHATGANLRGVVVPVWDSHGLMKFIAPRQWHPFFQGITLDWVMANLNRELFW